MFFAAAFLLVLLLSASPSPSAGQRDKECDSHNDCKSSEKCVGFMGKFKQSNEGGRKKCGKPRVLILCFLARRVHQEHRSPGELPEKQPVQGQGLLKEQV